MGLRGWGIGLGLALSVYSWGAAKSHETCPFQPLSKDFKRLNPSAKKPFDGTYTSPHERPLSEYHDILFGSGSRKSLLRLLPENGLAIDLGGGKGVAFRELAHRKKAKAIVVNTQTEVAPEISLNGRPKGVFEYRQGYAEEQLDKIDGQADLITDIWGAFSYSTEKAYLLERIYEKLKPGGSAFILIHPFKTETFVETEKGQEYFDDWLAAHFGDRLNVYHSPGQNTSSAKIIEIHKPKTGDTPFRLPLEAIKRENRHTSKGMDYPSITYRVRTP